MSGDTCGDLGRARASSNIRVAQPIEDSVLKRRRGQWHFNSMLLLGCAMAASAILAGVNSRTNAGRIAVLESMKPVSLETMQSATPVPIAPRIESKLESMSQERTPSPDESASDRKLLQHKQPAENPLFGLRPSVQTTSRIPFEGKELFDFNSSPEFVRNWVKKVLITSPCINKDAIIAQCCKRGCGGFADRVRGLGTLLDVAHQSGRKLCLSRDYFLFSPFPNCSAGKAITMNGVAMAVWKDPSNQRKPEAVKYDGNYNSQVFASLKFLSSGKAFDLKRDGMSDADKKLDSLGRARQLGMFALYLSQTIDREMRLARRAVLATVGLYSETNSFVSLHVRCGGSPFSLSTGQMLHATTKWDTGFKFPFVENLLRSARKLRPGMVCKKPLYIASDSNLFKSEMQSALPRGLTTLSCCSRALHIDKGERPLDNIQHLVDVQAFGLSDKVFLTGGGYAGTGLFAKQWEPVPSVSLSRHANETEASRYLQELVAALECA